ncbi:phosphocholine cytidylyltransferase family protein [Segnochrobactrum spirostomi]|uniref:Phosphocholine cytidylyltransferase family protein n=1 Tax=Segnochrobactrum spirostomi TaxID=2608987 RepID=A0A6A7Y6F3_9HYPH|nr:phosphocholine cytidylyltransferase family protein [Segnochrobactrum spirostomi]MQT14883.1 phosphocholine cytidylyltransferase family protein [Segnochrobactrum spirostomi]
MSVDTAIILAAGLGSRIAEFSRTAPKGFIPIAGRPIVERSIEILADHGIRRVIIGTGYRAHDYEALARRTGSLEIECVHNPDFAGSGSLETFLRCSVGLECSFLTLESDLLFDARMIGTVLECPAPNVILASHATHSGDEVYIETDDRAHLVALSKDRTALRRIDAELVGICKLTPAIPAAVERWLAAMSLPRPAQLHYEEGLAGIANTVPLPVETTPLPWTEIDTLQHLDRAEALIWPRIVSRSEFSA